MRQEYLPGHYAPEPSDDVRAYLKREDLLHNVAGFCLAFDLAPHLRGDGRGVGTVTAADAVSVLFPVPTNHNMRELWAHLSGMVIDGKFVEMGIEPLAPEVIEAAKREHIARAVPLWSALIRYLVKLYDLSPDE